MKSVAPYQADWPEFLTSVTAPECVSFCAVRVNSPQNEVLARIRTYAGEVPFALSLLDGIPLANQRVLDVGAGIGLTSFFLHRAGFNVTALEPGGIGFTINHSLFHALRDHLGCSDVPLLAIGAEALDPDRHGTFDVMFSSNVLEHVSDLPAVVEAMAQTLSPGGLMVHTCPNYTVPYEPHYKMPLLPFVPAATPWAGSRKSEDLWRSFNFVTVRKLGRLMRSSGLKPVFATGVMARAFERLLTDQGFAERHSPALARLAKMLNATGGMTLLKSWPPYLATPLIVTATKA